MSCVITDSGFFHAINAERSDEMAVFRIERTRDYTVMKWPFFVLNGPVIIP